MKLKFRGTKTSLFPIRETREKNPLLVSTKRGVFKVFLGAPLQKKCILLCENRSLCSRLADLRRLFRRRAHVVRHTQDGGWRSSVVGAFGCLIEVPDLRRLARRGTLGPREGNLLGLVRAAHGWQEAAGRELIGPTKHNAVRE